MTGPLIPKYAIRDAFVQDELDEGSNRDAIYLKYIDIEIFLKNVDHARRYEGSYETNKRIRKKFCKIVPSTDKVEKCIEIKGKKESEKSTDDIAHLGHVE